MRSKAQPPEAAPSGIDVFGREQSGALQRIARATPHRLKPEELVSEAYILACELGAKRGVGLDLSDPGDQDIVLACLYNRHVKFVRGKWIERRIDDNAEADSADATAIGTWHPRLRVPDNQEPLAHLLNLDEQRLEQIPARMMDFSELSAYRALLLRFDSDCKQLAAHLAISLSALRHRIERARERARVQLTLFGFELIDSNFLTRSTWFRRLRMAWQMRRAVWNPFRVDS